MDTMVHERIFGDADFTALARDMKDPLRAIGALVFVWHGTQNKKLTHATERELFDCFPLGYRGAKSAISALIRNGWLRETLQGYEVRGNVEHVAKKTELSLKAQVAARARWDSENTSKTMLRASGEHAPSIDRACSGHAHPVPVPVPDLNTARVILEIPPGPIDTETAARPTKVMEPLVLAEWSRLADQHKRPRPENYDGNHHRAAGAIYALYPSRWQEVLRKFATDAFYGNMSFSLLWLAKNAPQVDGRQASAPAGAAKATGGTTNTVPPAEATWERLNALGEAAPDEVSKAALAAIKNALNVR